VAFLSNKEDEKKILSPAFHKSVAKKNCRRDRRIPEKIINNYFFFITFQLSIYIIP